MIEDGGWRGFFEFYIDGDGMALAGANLSPIKTVLIALFVVGGDNLINEGTGIAQLGKFADLSPAVLVDPAIFIGFLVVTEEEG